MSISPDVVIMTTRELDDFKTKWFNEGIKRGRFEESSSRNNPEIAEHCANWKNGRCVTCGAQWQGHEVDGLFKCPHFIARRS